MVQDERKAHVQTDDGERWRGPVSSGDLWATTPGGTEDPPDPLPPSPAPAEEPAWRKELAQKLEGYRERRAKAGVQAEPPLLWPAKPGSPPAGDEQADSADPEHRQSESPVLPQSEPLRRKPDPPRKVAPAAEAVTPLSTADDQPAPTRAAPLKRRALACVFDLTLMLVHVGVFVAVLTYWRPGALEERALGTVAMVFFALLSFYWVLFIYYLGRTVGMLWVGLKVTALAGGDPEESQRLVRALGTVLSTAPLGIGFAWALIDEDKLTWHDRMSRTMIVESNR